MDNAILVWVYVEMTAALRSIKQGCIDISTEKAKRVNVFESANKEPRVNKLVNDSRANGLFGAAHIISEMQYDLMIKAGGLALQVEQVVNIHTLVR